MLFKRGSTISAAEGGCQAEVGGTFQDIVDHITHCVLTTIVPASCVLYGQCWVCRMHGWYVLLEHTVKSRADFHVAASPETVLQVCNIIYVTLWLYTESNLWY